MADDPEIIVLGTATATPEGFDELLAASLAHVRRSREEPGCLQHGVSRDAEDPLTLVFVERWANRAALEVHFTVPESAELVDVISRTCSGPGTLRLYEATRVR